MYSTIWDSGSSPTVNVAIPFPDYIKLLQDFNHLCKCDFEEVTDVNNGIESLKNVPKGLLGGVVKVYFVHYKSFEEGVEAWKRRVKRIHWENLYVVLVERDGCTLEDVRAFDRLTFKHKVALIHKPYEGVKCGYVFLVMIKMVRWATSPSIPTAATTVSMISSLG